MARLALGLNRDQLREYPEDAQETVTKSTTMITFIEHLLGARWVPSILPV